MAETASKMISLGTLAPDFSLTDVVTENTVTLKSVKSCVATVIMFICNHCPYVIHIRDKLLELIPYYQSKGISFVAISSNDVEHYPADSPSKMKALAKEYLFTFPYLYDETQVVAKAYQATCTPDFFVYDDKLQCVYRGRFDGSTPGNQVPVTGNELKAALEQILAGLPVNPDQKPSLGCNIKWKR